MQRGGIGLHNPIRVTVHPERKTKPLGDLFGIFFEDLNHAVDGGLYAEMVQNRSFEYSGMDTPTYHAMTAWSRVERGNALVKLHVEDAEPICKANPHYLVIDMARDGLGGVMNSGYNTGMNLQAGKAYIFSCWYRLRSRMPVDVKVRLESADGKVCYAEASFTAESCDWKPVELRLTASADDVGARLVVGAVQDVSLALDMVSLFPADTFNQRRNGLRTDLVQLLKDMKPKFLRFPGGCLTHCGSLNPNDHESMYRWKKTLGPVEQRPFWRNIWRHQQTLGLGFYEYFLLCEDIGAQPLPVIPAGWDPHTLRAAPIEDMQEWIDEALDLIEFANGAPDTTWGGIRVQLGHPAPFGLKYLAIGNEEVRDEFFERYEIMHRAVREKYPEIELIGSSGPGNAGDVFEQGWKQARELGAAYVDEHYYQAPWWFIANMHRYDAYPAEGTRAFLGEYASKDEKWWNALVEAAYMLGMEKAPGVGLACYAPLFCNADYVNWKPDMIWFNNHQAYGTASYHVQKLMMLHQGDHEVALTQEGGRTLMAEPSTVQGEIGFASDLADISVADVCLTNLDTGEEIRADAIHLCGETPSYLLANVEWTNYRVTFRALRNMDCDEKHFVGGRPFALEFGRKDADNMLRWIIDGWTNLTSIVQIREGELADLTASMGFPRKGEWQDCCLEVHGDVITIALDGKVYPSGILRQPDLEPLYTAASIDDATGELIVKVVNLQPAAADAVLSLMKFKAIAVEVTEMSGFRKDDANTFDEPFKVVPRTHSMPAQPEMDWTFPAESLTILRFKCE